MGFRLKHQESIPDGITRIASDRLDNALKRLSAIHAGDADAIKEAVHQTRKRCKEVRGLLRMVRPALGDHYAPAQATLRDAAAKLSTFRDAHALLETFDSLMQAHGARMDVVRGALADAARAATGDIHGRDPRIEVARQMLSEVRSGVAEWRVEDDFGSIAAGVRATYRRGRRDLALSRRDPDDEGMHDWRKRVKYLWYQMRLLELCAPSVLKPLVATLDALGHALGDDHDLAVLVEGLRAHPEPHPEYDAAIVLARREQKELRRRAVRLGARIYAERTRAFVDRLAGYWAAEQALGAELVTGRISAIHKEPKKPSTTMEHERKWLVTVPPPVTGAGDQIRQGYIAVDGLVSVRVRDVPGKAPTFTVKGGKGASRTEVEWEIDQVQFDALWALTGDRRVDKVRHRVPVGQHTAEVDIFEGRLEGLRFVEVEFEDESTMAAFEAPSWFGRDVTDDGRYTNASLAMHGPVRADDASE